MRLWTLHPKYLDTKGLLAAWREALLAQKVLMGQTAGYKQHPQLIRFREYSDPLGAIGTFLYELYLEAERRGYDFSKDKIDRILEKREIINVNKGQVLFEFEHLKKKLILRDISKYRQIENLKEIDVNSIFIINENTEIETWEKTGG